MDAGQHHPAVPIPAEGLTVSYRSQAIASTLLGTPLSFLLAGFYMQFGPGEPATDFLVANLLLVPIWTAVMVWGLKRERGQTVWLWLGIVLLIGLALLYIARRALEG